MRARETTSVASLNAGEEIVFARVSGTFRGGSGWMSEKTVSPGQVMHQEIRLSHGGWCYAARE